MEDQEEKTIFELLEDANICYAIVMSLMSFKIKGLDQYARDWMVIIRKRDYVVKKDILCGFTKNYEYKDLYERELTEDEIKLFKANKEAYVMVQRNNDGRIYEQKKRSFQKLYKTGILS